MNAAPAVPESITSRPRLSVSLMPLTTRSIGRWLSAPLKPTWTHVAGDAETENATTPRKPAGTAS